MLVAADKIKGMLSSIAACSAIVSLLELEVTSDGKIIFELPLSSCTDAVELEIKLRLSLDVLPIFELVLFSANEVFKPVEAEDP